MDVKINRQFQIKNSHGFMSVDFMFAILIAAGLCSVLFALAFSFVNVEIAQYIAFATSRIHSMSHLDVATQEAAARRKYDSLLKDPRIGNVFSNGWISISPAKQVEIRSDANSNFNQDYRYQADPTYSFVGVPYLGVRTQLKFNMLDFNVPFLGRTSDEGADTFRANVTSFLIREPSFQECHSFFDAPRYDAILNLDPRFQKAQAAKAHYVNLEDNGC